MGTVGMSLGPALSVGRGCSGRISASWLTCFPADMGAGQSGGAMQGLWGLEESQEES